MSGEAIGMMEGAFFVSKGVILEWMNELLDVSLQNILTTLFSYNCQKSSSVRRALCIARSWIRSTQGPSTCQKSSGEPSSIMSS